MIQAQRVRYRPLSYQRAFHNSEKPKVYLSAGYGAGKTYSLCMKLLQLCSLNKGLAGGLLTPDLKMFKRDVLPTIKEVCQDNNISFTFHQTEYYFTFPQTGSTVYVFHGQDDGRSIRGPNLAFMVINEVSLLKKVVFDAAIARVRLRNARLRQVAMSGTPEGFGWCYEYFVENPRDDTDFIYGNTAENSHLAEDYIQNLRDSYDEMMVKQYVEGQFVNLTGRRAAWAFNRSQHVKPVDFIESAHIWVSMDFNADPMSAVLWQPIRQQLRDGRTKTKLRAYDEIAIRDSNTYQFSEVLQDKLPSDWRDRYVTIYPDPAGKARSTAVDPRKMPKSDIDILKSYGFNDIKYKKRILSVKDCLNSLNNLFSKDLIDIDPKCKNFIADLERCTIKEGTTEIDKTDSQRSHWLDGSKNMADYEFPVTKSYSKVISERIR